MEVLKVNVNISDIQSYKNTPTANQSGDPKPSNKTMFKFQRMHEFIDVTAKVTTDNKIPLSQFGRQTLRDQQT